MAAPASRSARHERFRNEVHRNEAGVHMVTVRYPSAKTTFCSAIVTSVVQKNVQICPTEWRLFATLPKCSKVRAIRDAPERRQVARWNG